nr:disulfide bond formation protein B [uncultured Jannaschia sp.]
MVFQRPHPAALPAWRGHRARARTACSCSGRAGFSWRAAAAGTTATLGLNHTGVERDWREGPPARTGGASDPSAMGGADFLSFDTAEAPVLCDEVVWEFLSLSMASWNAILSALPAGVWIAALVLSRRAERV